MGKQFRSAGQGRYAFFVIDFHLFNQNIFFFGIQFRGHRADGFNAAPAMGLRRYACRVEPMPGIPGLSLAFHGWGGIHQHAIHIKENCFGREDHLPE